MLIFIVSYMGKEVIISHNYLSTMSHDSITGENVLRTGGRIH